MSLESMTVSSLISSLGKKTPTPGGGAVSSIVTALSAALGIMVVRYSTGKKTLAEHDELHREALNTLDELTSRALSLADEDARAYDTLNELMKANPDDDEPNEEWTRVVEAAIDAPVQVMSVCLELMHLLDRLAGKTNRMLSSDLAIAAILSEAGAQAAAWNVRTNLPLLKDEGRVNDIRRETDRLLSRARLFREQIEASCSTTG